ncbi:MAG: hypothetical protein FWG41_01370, partial [Methanomassiliicoccaceae archaeon]|nr:hypothetical protein [Methanomassiliicoccaceae archaeon]
CEQVSNKGCRVYLLLGSEDKNASLDSIKGMCYIRFGLKQEGGVCITRPVGGQKCQAWLFPDSSMECGTALSENESESQYRTFCKQFWVSDGRTEYYSQEQKRPEGAQKSTIEEIHLYDTLSLPGTYSKTIQDKMERNWNEITALFPITNYETMVKVLPEDTKYSATTIIIDGKKEKDITRIKKYSNETWLAESDVPVFSTLSNGAVSLFSPSDIVDGNVNWTSERTQKDHEKYVNGFQRRWKLSDSVKINDIKSKEIRFLDQPSLVRKVEEEYNVEEDVLAEDIDEYFDYDEEKLIGRTKFTRNLLYCHVYFEFTIYPPALPKGAYEDPLYTKWDEADKKWMVALDGRKAILNRVEKEIYEHKSKTDTFNRAKLGAKQRISELSEEIEKLKSVKMGLMTPARREEKLRDYKKLFENTNKIVKSLEDDIYIDKETAEREKKIPIKEKEIEEKEEKISNIDESIRKVGIEIDGLKKTIGVEKDKNHKKQLSKEMGKKQSSMKQLKRDKESEEKALNSQRDELNKLKEKISVPDEELSNLLKTNEKNVETFEFPPEDLPDCKPNCKLYVHGGQRYLAFENGVEEEDIRGEKTKHTAKRLNAKICIGG